MSRSSSSSRSSGVCFGVFGASSSAEACGFGVFGASSSAEACGFGVFGASSSAEACGFGVFGASSSAEACGFGVLAAFFSYEVFGFRVFGFGACFVFAFRVVGAFSSGEGWVFESASSGKTSVFPRFWLLCGSFSGWPASQSLVWDRDLLGRPRFLEAWCGQGSAHFLGDILQSFSKPRCPRPLAPMGWPLLLAALAKEHFQSHEWHGCVLRKCFASVPRWPRARNLSARVSHLCKPHLLPRFRQIFTTKKKQLWA